MQSRLNYIKASPASYQALLALQATVDKCGLEKPLLELVKIRASQINKCAFCLHMHTRDARQAGVSEERIYLLEAWRESPLYTDRERAALAWTEALTLLPETNAPDDVYAAVAAQFSEPEIVGLTLAIGAINLWNRFGVGFRLVHPHKAPLVEA
ncbi:MAG: carboxymuconolactone decarboxylase family protein [Microvirga sp.]